MMKKGNVFWGIVMLLLAVLVIVNELGMAQGIGMWTVIFTVVFGASLFQGIVRFETTQILFSVAFLCIVWDDVLHLQAITPWPVLLAATFGSIGCSMIFGGSKKRHYANKFYGKHDMGKETIEQDYGEEVNCSVSFGSIAKYIQSENLKSVNISASFGGAAIYFDHATVPSGEVVVDIDTSFSGIELFLPKDWFVTNNVQSTFGGVDIENKNTGVNAVNVVLIGSCSFAGVTVTYI